MPRQPKLAHGLAALALCLGLAALGGSPRPARAADTAPTVKTRAEGALHSIENSVKNLEHKVEASLKGAEHDIKEHESVHEPDILEPQPSLALWTVVVFVGLLLVLTVFAWKPLLAALHHREEHLEHVLTETERARNEAEQLLAEHRRRLAATEEQVRSMIDEARKSAQAISDETLRKAQAEADASRQRAQREIETARDQALSEIWSKTADLAVSVAGKVLKKSLNDDDHRRLIDSAVAELPDVRPTLNVQGSPTA